MNLKVRIKHAGGPGEPGGKSLYPLPQSNSGGVVFRTVMMSMRIDSHSITCDMLIKNKRYTCPGSIITKSITYYTSLICCL